MKTKMKLAYLSIVIGFNLSAQTISLTTTTPSSDNALGNGTSIRFGTSSGNSLGNGSTSANNSFIGYESGKLLTSSSNNTFLGFQSGKSFVSGSGENTFVGSQSGSFAVGTQNTFVGFKAGGSISTSTGNGNTYFGWNAGGANSTSYDNVSVGAASGRIIGNHNISIGYYAGTSSGPNPQITGSGNVFIGNHSGSNLIGTFNNRLQISNHLSSTPLIWGDFVQAQLKFRGKTGVGMSITESFPTAVGGTNISTYNLFVRGGILSDEVRVRTNWADYVFLDDYKLPSLEEVESYIETNGHLINVPSAKQVEEEGIEVGQMAKIQQEKIEELTLYLIQQKKEIDLLKAQVQLLLERK